MLKIWARRAVVAATTVGAFAARHKIVSGVAILFVLAAVGASTFSFSALGRSDTDQFYGSTAPGSHEWWDHTQAEDNFCNQCHQGIRQELDNTPQQEKHSGENCAFCHSPGGNQHAADPAKCVDCHSNEATQLTNDAHAGILTDLGEDANTASWTCKACHTHVDVEFTTDTNPALPLHMDATYP